MEHIQSQFSFKFEPIMKIRRESNMIEDFLQEKYLPPITTPIPDDFVAEAPRIIFASKNGHSQIHFSQISVDFSVNFDGGFVNDYLLCEEYVNERFMLVYELLKKMNVKQYYYFGVTNNVLIDTKNFTSIEYMKSLVNGVSSIDNIYEIFQRVATIEDDKYFVNKQFSNFTQYKGTINNISNLVSIPQGEVVLEGVNFSLDINNRYTFIKSGKLNQIEEIMVEKKAIFDKVKDVFSKMEV